MNELMKQLSGLTGAGIAGACCLGVPVLLSALTALGLGFLIRDAFLIPIFAAMLGFNLWLLYRSSGAHADRTPFWIALAGSGAALGGLYIAPWVVIAGMLLLVAGSLIDYRNGRRRNGCKPDAGPDTRIG